MAIEATKLHSVVMALTCHRIPNLRSRPMAFNVACLGELQTCLGMPFVSGRFLSLRTW